MFLLTRLRTARWRNISLPHLLYQSIKRQWSGPSRQFSVSRKPTIFSSRCAKFWASCTFFRGTGSGYWDCCLGSTPCRWIFRWFVASCMRTLLTRNRGPWSGLFGEWARRGNRTCRWSGHLLIFCYWLGLTANVRTNGTGTRIRTSCSKKLSLKALVTYAPQSDENVEPAQKHLFLLVLDLVQVDDGLDAEEIADEAEG